MKQKNILVIVIGAAALVSIQLPACKPQPKQAAESTIAETKEAPDNTPSAADSAALYAHLLASDANELNSQCPITIDKETRLDNAQPMVKENTLRYNYTLVNREKNSFTNLSKVKERMTPGLINLVKTNPDLEIYRQHNTTLEYYYKDKNGEFLFNVSVTPDLYNKQ